VQCLAGFPRQQRWRIHESQFSEHRTSGWRALAFEHLERANLAQSVGRPSVFANAI
jgi:hypothetical protein